MNTITSVASVELAKQYRAALDRFYAYLTAVQQIVIEDFPGPDGRGATRYHLDTINDLTARLAALVDGYERRG